LSASNQVVFITAPSVEVGEQIARELLKQKLAACVNLLPGIRSLYTWREELQVDQEVLLVVKTRADLFSDRLVPLVQMIHPYELPEIIALPIDDGLPAYLNWIQQESTGGSIEPASRPGLDGINTGRECTPESKARPYLDLDRLIDRQASDSYKWHRYDPDVLPLWVADMDFPSPEPVIRALRERVEHGIFGYPQGIAGLPKELPELRRVLMDRLEHLYGWQVQPEEILFLPGVVTGFNLVAHAVATAGGSILVQPPVYPPILHAAENAGMARLDNELLRNADGSYSIDWQALQQAFRDPVRLFLLCNPHNPVGRVFRKDELERVAELCLRHKVTICSDEIHCDLLYPGHSHIPIASLDPEIAQNTVTLMAPSKTFNIAGLQFSFAVVQNAGLRNQLKHAHHGLVGWVNLMGLTAGLAAYRDGQGWLDQVLAYLLANRDYLMEFVRNELPELNMVLPEGTYLAWLDCRQAGIPGNPYEFFLKEARVALNDGATFGPGGEGFVRLNFGCPRATLQEGLERMQRALQTLAPHSVNH
jgi:cystathionine beta-lyase